MKRFAILAVFLGLGAITLPQLASDAHVSYRVIHGWPKYDRGFTTGQVTGVAVDSHNCVFVFHREVRPVLRIDGDSGEVLASWGDGIFKQAHGLSVDQKDNVWVTDSDAHAVFKFSHEGELLATFGKKGEPGEDAEHFNRPTDVEVGPDGSIYVADGYGNSRIVKLSSEGEFLTAWGVKGTGPGEFDTPHGIAIDSQGRLYVADRGNSRIQVFDSGGKVLHEWKGKKIGRPWGLDVTPDGSLIVADGGDLVGGAFDRNRALRLDLKGNVLEEWGSYGQQDGQFYWAHDIAAGPNGDVYVTDVNVGMRVQKFVRHSAK